MTGPVYFVRRNPRFRHAEQWCCALRLWGENPPGLESRGVRTAVQALLALLFLGGMQ